MAAASECAINDGTSRLRVESINDFLRQDWNVDCHGEPVSNEALRIRKQNQNQSLTKSRDKLKVCEIQSNCLGGCDRNKITMLPRT